MVIFFGVQMEQNQEELTLEETEKIWNEEAKKSAEDDLPEYAAESNVEQKAEPEIVEEPQEEVEVSANKSEDVQEEPKVEDKPEDPFDGLPDAVKEKLAKIDDIEKANANLLHHVKTAEGRVAAMQRELEISRRVKEEVSKNETPSQKQIKSAGKNPEKWEELKADFPDWASAIEEYVAAKGVAPSQQPVLDEKKLAGYIDQKLNANKQEMIKNIEYSKLDDRYEDWRGTLASAEFSTWFNSQPHEVRELANSNLAKDAAKVIDMFEESKQKPVTEIKQNRTAKLAQAASPDKRNQTPPPKSLEDMTAEELWHYEARKREKTREQRGF